MSVGTAGAPGRAAGAVASALGAAAAADAAAGGGAVRKSSDWHKLPLPESQTDGLFSAGLKPMYSTFLPATSSPTRRMRGLGSPVPWSAATDHNRSVDSVMMN